GRLDEAAALCSLFLRRFKTGYSRVAAGHHGIVALMRLASPKRAVRLGQLWLGGRTLLDMDEAFGLDRRIWLTLVHYARACQAAGDRPALGQLSQQVNDLEKAKVDGLWPWRSYIAAYRNDMDGYGEAAERWLKPVSAYVATRSAPHLDLLAESMAPRIRHAEEQGTTAVKAMLDEWLSLDAEAVAPRLRRGRLLLDMKQPGLAAHDSRELLANPKAVDVHEDALRLLLAARNLQYASVGLDAQSLYQTLLSKKVQVPTSVPDPVLYLGIAELAMANEKWAMAIDNLREASEHFRWSRAILLRRARSNHALGRESLHDIEEILAEHPDHLEARLLQIRALDQRDDPGKLRSARVELLRRHPQHPESVAILVGHLLARRAWKEVLDVAVDVSDRKTAWARAQAHSALGAPLDALKALAQITKDDPKWIDSIGFAITTAAHERLADRVPNLCKTFLDADPGPEDLLRIGNTLAAADFHTEALQVLQPIVATNKFADQRSGDFYVRIGRMQHGLGRVAAARDSWDAAFPFEDGSPAFTLLAVSYMTSGLEDAANEVLAQTKQLTGHPLTRAYVHWQRKDRAAALAAIDDFRTASPSLAQTLRVAIDADLPVSTNKPAPRIETIHRALDRLVRRDRCHVLEALLLAPGTAFQAQASKGLAAIVNNKAKTAGDEAWYRLLVRAWHDDLCGRRGKAIGNLLQLVHDAPLNLPGYDELIALTETDHPHLLTTTDMLARFVRMIQYLPSDVWPYTRITTHWLRATADIHSSAGDYASARKQLECARLVAPNDSAATLLLASLALKHGDLPSALLYEMQRYKSVPKEAQGPVLVRAVDLALQALEKHKGKNEEASTNALVKEVVAAAREQWGNGEEETIGRAGMTVLFCRAGEHGLTDKVAAPRELLQQALAPYAAARLTPALDANGIRLAFIELRRAGGHKEALALVERILTIDPSLFDLWVLRAQLEQQMSRPAQALRSLRWIPRILPTAKAVRNQVAVLRALYPEHHIDEAKALHALLGKETHEARIARATLGLRLEEDDALQSLADASPGLGKDVDWLRDLALILSLNAELAPIEARMRARGEDPCFPGANDIAVQLGHLLTPSEPKR
ncbi:MAG: hypothetical protein CMJ85_09055, partial [Planctomycetes bacterium]|nr:hypothetical protein [Planctomycetota bacterium]